MKMRRTACMVGGAAGMYLLDPVLGRSRRARAKDQLRSRIAELRDRRRGEAEHEVELRRAEGGGREVEPRVRISNDAAPDAVAARGA